MSLVPRYCGGMLPGIIEPDSLDEWIESWDRQQELYVVNREQRFTVALDTIAGLAGDASQPLRFLDLGCGPAAFGTRLLDRFDGSTYVGVDLDPVLLRLGDAVAERYGGRCTIRTGDLTSDTWSEGLVPGSFDAIVSSTALHWLGVADLGAVFRTCRELLTDRGVLLNADNLRYGPGSAPLQRLSDVLEIEHQRRAQAGGALNWHQWWERARADDVLGPFVELRDAIYPAPQAVEVTDTDDGNSPPPLADLYEALLGDAGFEVVDTVWQYFDDRVLVALSKR